MTKSQIYSDMKKKKEAVGFKNYEFSINGTEGTCSFNKIKNKYQVDIDMIDFELVYESERFDTENDMNDYLNNL